MPHNDKIKEKVEKMARPRKKPLNIAAEGDPLTQVLKNIPADKLRAALKRDRMFTFRLSEMDRETMDEVAKAMDLSTAEYLIRIHHHVYEKMREAGVVK